MDKEENKEFIRLLKLWREDKETEMHETMESFGAIRLAGRLKSLAIAAKFDTYLSEKMEKGYQKELNDIKHYEFQEAEYE